MGGFFFLPLMVCFQTHSQNATEVTGAEERVALSPQCLWWGGEGGYRAQHAPTTSQERIAGCLQLLRNPIVCPVTSLVAQCSGDSGWKMEKGRVGPG